MKAQMMKYAIYLASVYEFTVILSFGATGRTHWGVCIAVTQKQETEEGSA